MDLKATVNLIKRKLNNKLIFSFINGDLDKYLKLAESNHILILLIYDGASHFFNFCNNLFIEDSEDNSLIEDDDYHIVQRSNDKNLYIMSSFYLRNSPDRKVHLIDKLYEDLLKESIHIKVNKLQNIIKESSCKILSEFNVNTFNKSLDTKCLLGKGYLIYININK